MMQQHIDRSRQTRGGMTASVVLHAGLLLLLAVVAGGQVARSALENDLVEIAYIEARYGEDVAAKVKLKEGPRARPEPPGRGVNTDSAMKAAEPATPEPPRPEPRPLTRPELPVTQPAQRQVVAEVAAPVVETTAQPQLLAEATQLAARAERPRNRVVIDPGRLNDQPRAASDDVTVPTRVAPRPKGRFKPQEGALQSRSGAVALGGDIRPDTGNSSAGGRVALAEAPGGVATGGALVGSSRSTYQAPQAALAPPGSGGGRKGGKGVLDVAGPAGSGGGKKSGRKTILNYGSGSGGRGGSLSGRARLAEPEPTTKIVTEKAAEPATQQAVAEVKLDGKGVGMTISGQIQGRKIIKSVVPEYTALARRKGWEGVVAVHFTVLADGRVKDNTYFEQSSVHRDLNKMALEAIKQFRFAPLPAGQAAVEQWGVITIVFRLN